METISHITFDTISQGKITVSICADDSPILINALVKRSWDIVNIRTENKDDE